ncbi:MAG: rRNA maturation RNase YbeY [Saprospiraceae bacterium]|nr:rRNA maturation RNase YbeY [Saprospiraceae bacterium]
MNSENIEFHFQEVEFELNQPKISQWIKDILGQNKRALDNVNIVLCNDEYLLEINRQHLQHDYYTDIITFPYQDEPVVADIFISVDRVRENAETYNTSEQMEMLRVIIHGIFHIVGKKDKTVEEELEMRKLEDEAIIQYEAMKMQ